MLSSVHHLRASGAVVVVLKRSGQREPFERRKVVAGVRAACKNRPVDSDAIEMLATDVEEVVRSSGPEITSEGVGRAVLERLRALDDVASVRFASVYKGFEEAGDFARELGLLREDRDGRDEVAGPRG
jgi:transcriptional repressor NrdR